MRVRIRTFSGQVLEQEILTVSDRVKDKRQAEKRLRFHNEEERAAHRAAIALRRFIRRFNASFSPTSLYSTLTFNDDHEVHTFEEAKLIRRSYAREIKKIYPGAWFIIVMGRGKSTGRIHFHMVSQGVPAQVIEELWEYGSIKECRRLRKKNKTPEGVDCGQDYTGLATYLYNHWTPEQGGHRCYMTKNCPRQEREEPTEVKRSYSEDKPPIAPKGYRLIETKATPYGYLYFKYVREEG